MAMRWLDPVPPLDKDVTTLTGTLNEAFVTFDLDTTPQKETRLTTTCRCAAPVVQASPTATSFISIGTEREPQVRQLFSVEQLATD